MAKTIDTIDVIEVNGDDTAVLKINKCDFDKEKYKVVRKSLTTVEHNNGGSGEEAALKPEARPTRPLTKKSKKDIR